MHAARSHMLEFGAAEAVGAVAQPAALAQPLTFTVVGGDARASSAFN